VRAQVAVEKVAQATRACRDQHDKRRSADRLVKGVVENEDQHEEEHDATAGAEQTGENAHGKPKPHGTQVV